MLLGVVAGGWLWSVCLQRTSNGHCVVVEGVLGECGYIRKIGGFIWPEGEEYRISLNGRRRVGLVFWQEEEWRVGVDAGVTQSGVGEAAGE